MSTTGSLIESCQSDVLVQLMVERANKALGARIKLAILNSGRQQNEIAATIGVTPQAVNKWIRTGKIKRDHLYSLAKETGVSWEWLLTGEGPLYQKTLDTSHMLEKARVFMERLARVSQSDHLLPKDAERLEKTLEAMGLMLDLFDHEALKSSRAEPSIEPSKKTAA